MIFHKATNYTVSAENDLTKQKHSDNVTEKQNFVLTIFVILRDPAFLKKKSLADVLVIYKSWRKKKLTHPVLILAHWSAS